MSKYTKSARDQDCQIRIPGVCNFNPETTVFAHLNGGGMGMKKGAKVSILGAYACSACHDAVDGRGMMRVVYPYWEVNEMHYEGMVRTIELMVKNGVLKL